jgi:hypothetical protein
MLMPYQQNLMSIDPLGFSVFASKNFGLGGDSERSAPHACGKLMSLAPGGTVKNISGLTDEKMYRHQ